jgi:NADPH-dependent curcumin reductase CurA
LNVCFQVLKKEYPRGVDIIYESVGGEMFDLCLNALAVHGRLVVIGMISQVRSSAYNFFCLNYIMCCEYGNSGGTLEPQLLYDFCDFRLVE